jgi:hypothetical protein
MKPIRAEGASTKRFSILVVRRRDTQPMWTWIALGGLAVSLGLAIFGLPHADIHGLLHYVGVMDPFCGGTRSMYLTLEE